MCLKFEGGSSIFDLLVNIDLVHQKYYTTTNFQNIFNRYETEGRRNKDVYTTENKCKYFIFISETKSEKIHYDPRVTKQISSKRKH
jgi:hypothetical protein